MKTDIKLDALYWASFDRFELRLPGECVSDCSHQGDCDDDVKYWTPKIMAQIEKDNFPNRPTAEKIRAELKEYGAWDEGELADDEMNMRRLVWCSACNIAEEENPDHTEPCQ